MPQHHPTAPRGSDLAPRSVFLEGRYGRMFRYLPPLEIAEGDLDKLDDLAKLMFERDDAGKADEERDKEFDGPIPAGFTYFGQFIDHDITFDPVSSLQRLQDPEGLADFRTPRLDLDSLYGDGPNDNPFMYNPDVDDGATTFLIGKNDAGENDLPRNTLAQAQGLPRGRALIGDPRNDENIIVSQIHLLFLKFHNKVVEVVRQRFPGLKGNELFIEAQRVARWHYQWLVVHDFLRRVVGQDVIKDILVDGAWGAGGKGKRRDINLLFYSWRREPFMPVEFSVGAYRFGHSMIRPDYRLNKGMTEEIPIFTSKPLVDEKDDLSGFRPLPGGFEIDWSFFFEVGDPSHLQHARKIDTKLAAPLKELRLPLTDKPRSLAKRNLRRGRALGLPTGERVAQAMGLEPILIPALGSTRFGGLFDGRAPLWYYILREAEDCGGDRLGPVGGRIVAEVLLGLLKGDRFSYVHDPRWAPDLPAAKPGTFTLADLVTFTAPDQ